jgi:hypothetical protein
MRLSLSLLSSVLVCGILFTGCSKDETVEVHENHYISGNIAPPYTGVTTIQVTNYVNKMYIDLLGEEPSTAQLDADVAFLEANSLDEASRLTVIGNIMANPSYFDRLWIVTSTELIEGVSADLLDEEILTYEYISDLFYQQGDTFSAQIIEYELTKLYNLKNADADLAAGTITLNEFYARFIFNLIYDEINMGSENFVAACFQNLYYRYPTTSELTNGVTMVDGFPAVVLLESGNSKEDFISIVSESEEFYEGLVSSNFLSLVLREPTSTEMGTHAVTLSNNGSLQELQQNVIKTDEYAGF